MTPLHFEEMYQDEWTELEASLDCLLARRVRKSAPFSSVSAARVAALYRRACEHLALARARCYPAYMVDRLERLTATAQHPARIGENLADRCGRGDCEARAHSHSGKMFTVVRVGAAVATR